jgi:hypothetical protein
LIIVLRERLGEIAIAERRETFRGSYRRSRAVACETPHEASVPTPLKAPRAADGLLIYD